MTFRKGKNKQKEARICLLKKRQKGCFRVHWHRRCRDCKNIRTCLESDTTYQPVWPDLAKIRHFCHILKAFGLFSKPSFCIGHKFEPTLGNFHAIGQIYIGVSGQILTNNLAIWSHWFQEKMDVKNYSETR